MVFAKYMPISPQAPILLASAANNAKSGARANIRILKIGMRDDGLQFGFKLRSNNNIARERARKPFSLLALMRNVSEITPLLWGFAYNGFDFANHAHSHVIIT